VTCSTHCRPTGEPKERPEPCDRIEPDAADATLAIPADLEQRISPLQTACPRIHLNEKIEGSGQPGPPDASHGLHRDAEHDCGVRLDECRPAWRSCGSYRQRTTPCWACGPASDSCSVSSRTPSSHSSSWWIAATRRSRLHTRAVPRARPRRLDSGDAARPGDRGAGSVAQVRRSADPLSSISHSERRCTCHQRLF